MSSQRNRGVMRRIQIFCRVLRPAIGLGVVAFLIVGGGCHRAEPGIVLYADQDPQVVESLVRQIQADVGTPVRVVCATSEQVAQGIGLAQRVREERKADVYWAGNPMAMQKVMDDGLLLKMKTPLTVPYVLEARDPDFYWVGLDARFRVILYHRGNVPRHRIPDSLASLRDPQWRGKAAMAHPKRSFSARYHLMTLFALASEADARELLSGIRTNQVRLLESEQVVVDAVTSGKVAWGITDSDVAEQAVRSGAPVDYVVPDQKSGSTARAMGIPPEALPTMGTPLLVTPVGLLKDRPLRGEAENLFKAMVKLSTANALATRIQPARLPTHEALLDSPPATSKNRIKDFRRLLLASLSSRQAKEAEMRVALAVEELLGP